VYSSDTQSFGLKIIESPNSLCLAVSEIFWALELSVRIEKSRKKINLNMQGRIYSIKNSNKDSFKLL